MTPYDTFELRPHALPYQTIPHQSLCSAPGSAASCAPLLTFPAASFQYVTSAQWSPLHPGVFAATASGRIEHEGTGEGNVDVDQEEDDEEDGLCVVLCCVGEGGTCVEIEVVFSFLLFSYTSTVSVLIPRTDSMPCYAMTSHHITSPRLISHT